MKKRQRLGSVSSTHASQFDDKARKAMVALQSAHNAVTIGDCRLSLDWLKDGAVHAGRALTHYESMSKDLQRQHATQKRELTDYLGSAKNAADRCFWRLWAPRDKSKTFPR